MVDTHFAPEATNCPYHQGGDERKSAPAPAATPGAIVVEKLGLARQILRSDRVRQAGFRAELLERFGRREHAPVLFQAGEAHQKQRSAIARFFAPKTVSGRYRALMERLSDRLIARLRAARHAQLDLMSLDIAVAVAAEIVGHHGEPASPHGAAAQSLLHGERRNATHGIDRLRSRAISHVAVLLAGRASRHRRAQKARA